MPRVTIRLSNDDEQIVEDFPSEDTMGLTSSFHAGIPVLTINLVEHNGTTGVVHFASRYIVSILVEDV